MGLRMCGGNDYIDMLVFGSGSREEGAQGVNGSLALQEVHKKRGLGSVTVTYTYEVKDIKQRAVTVSEQVRGTKFKDGVA